jgi:large subunit ribosomal protein L20
VYLNRAYRQIAFVSYGNEYLNGAVDTEILDRHPLLFNHFPILRDTKYGARSRVYRVAFQAVIKAGQYAYRDRRQKKRQFRALWIARINAGARLNGLSYSRMIAGLKKAQVIIDRRVLADIAMHDAVAFAALASKAKDALAA